MSLQQLWGTQSPGDEGRGRRAEYRLPHSPTWLRGKGGAGRKLEELELGRAQQSGTGRPGWGRKPESSWESMRGGWMEARGLGPPCQRAPVPSCSSPRVLS